MKNKLVKQTAIVVVMGLCLVFLFYAGYRYGGSLDNDEIITLADGTSYMQGETKEELIDHDTEYVLESHNLDNDKITAKTENVPVELIGLSKKEVIDYITSHMEQFQEKGEEVKNISMISFSHDTLVLRKDVTDSIAISETIKKYQNDNPYNYYMVLEDGYLIVYKQDKTTVFLETGIREDELDETDRAQLLQGVGVKNISDGMFCATALKNITIPGSVTKIGEDAFSYCQNLKKATLHEGVKKISKDAFSNTALEEITIPSTVTKLGKNAFRWESTEKSSLKKVVIRSKNIKKWGTMVFGATRDDLVIYVPQSKKAEYEKILRSTNGLDFHAKIVGKNW